MPTEKEKLARIYSQKKTPGVDVRSILDEVAADLVGKQVEKIVQAIERDTREYAQERVDALVSVLQNDAIIAQNDLVDAYNATIAQFVQPKDGAPGMDGKDGKDGVGQPGKPGKDGAPGMDGLPGKDGSPDTPDQIIEKINVSKLFIEPARIAGLTTELIALRNLFRESQRGGGGGGMGNWVHQAFNLTSGTTLVTLSNRVAANGTAAIVRYQGQVLAMNTEYSISGKTITLLFTPSDSTVLDVTYVRA